MTPKDPFLEGTFWDKFWRPIRSRALLFTPFFPVFFPFFFRFLSFHFQKTGRHRSQDPFCETPIEASAVGHSA